LAIGFAPNAATEAASAQARHSPAAAHFTATVRTANGVPIQALIKEAGGREPLSHAQATFVPGRRTSKIAEILQTTYRPPDSQRVAGSSPVRFDFNGQRTDVKARRSPI
jgi:hypothetical protein